MSILKRLLTDESGATAIEYGLIAAGISVAIIATVQGLGNQAHFHLHQRPRRPELKRTFSHSLSEPRPPWLAAFSFAVRAPPSLGRFLFAARRPVPQPTQRLGMNRKGPKQSQHQPGRFVG